MYPPFIEHSRRLLTEHDTTIVFVDIGSRNGVIELKDVAQFVKAYGFEPNPDEYEKLMTGKTDAAAFGIHSPHYKSLIYSPYALANEAGNFPFYVTRGPGAAGMIEPDTDRLKEIRWKGAAYKKNFAEEIFTVEKTVEVQAKTLAHFVQEQKLSFIDYLKIDVEGSEYDVLTGAGDFLKHVGVVKVEVCFIPFRKKQKLFSEVDMLLRQYGFDLLRYEVSPDQIGLKERTTSWSFGPTIGVPERFGQPLQADAIYVNRSITDPKRCLAQAMVLLDKKYLDEALFILKNKTEVRAPEFFEQLRTFRGPWRLRLLDAVFRFGRWILKPNPQRWK